MLEIAYTTVGRNAIFMGLISHFSAMLAGMLPASGNAYFQIVFLFSYLFLIIGAYAELKRRNGHPIKEGLFYVILAVTALPLIGPIISLGLLYRSQKTEQRGRAKVSGFFPALFRIKANILIIILLGVFLIALFILTNSKNGPYHERRYRNYRSGNVPQMVFAAGLQTKVVHMNRKCGYEGNIF